MSAGKKSFGQLHHLEFYSNDLSASRQFWAEFLEHFGWTSFQDWPEGFSYRSELGPYIVFVQVRNEFLEFRNNRQAQGFNHFAFHGHGSSDFEKVKDLLQSRGGKVLEESADCLCFEAPDGIVGEVFA